MKKYGFAILGTGLIAKFHAMAVQDTPGVELVAVCSRSQGSADKFAEQFGCAACSDLDAMLKQPGVDVLMIANPSGAHLEPAVAAAAAGVHVLCEKPLEISLDRSNQMIVAHEAAGTQLGCIFQLRHIPALQPIRQAIKNGRFGTITHAAVTVPWWRESAYYQESSWHGTQKLDGGGALMNQSIHMIDILCDLMPPVKSVVALTSSIGHPGIEVEDAASASLLFEGGALGTIVGTTSSWPGRAKRLEITGTKGTVVLEDDHLVMFEFMEQQAGDDDIRHRYSAPSNRSGAADPGAMDHTRHALCVQSFIKALSDNVPYAVTGRDACKSIALIEKIYSCSVNS
ncbi:MAG: Gfo/Idh/MocA family oxidoreductase [Kiritimatiellae bacterium]|jgi:UDP-N-acetyl-2-amino-2-deoxyglucuronate dehydrogenase|nr:Gfo/Idh/MocA family oxidoreductase [Kiritimatiellia bacterium]